MTVLENGIVAGAWRWDYGANERYDPVEREQQICDHCGCEIGEDEDAYDGLWHDTLCSECYEEEEK